MAKFNQLGQWTLQGNEDHLLLKTAEQRSSGGSDSKNLKKGKDVVNEEFAKIDMQVGVDKFGQKLQPTDEELFGHLVVSEKVLKKAKEDWKNTIGNSIKKVREPIDSLNKNDKLDFKWEDGKSFNDYLSEKEVSERGKVVG